MRKYILFIFMSSLLLTALQGNTQTWSSSKRLTWLTWDSQSARIANGSGNRIYIAWQYSIIGGSEIYFKKSWDGGTTWGVSRRLTWSSGDCIEPDIMADSVNGVHIGWGGFSPGNWEIFYKRSTDNGIAWSSLKRLTWNSGSSLSPEMATDSSNINFLVYEDEPIPGNFEIYFKKSTDNGVTWIGLKRLSWGVYGSFNPSIAVDSNDYIHLVWSDILPSAREIYYKKSTDKGVTWSPNKRLTWNPATAWSPFIAIGSDDSIHVVWYDNSKMNDEVFYKNSTDNGVTWSGKKRLTWNSGNSHVPVMGVDSNLYVHVVWQDDSSGNNEIYHKFSTNSGVTWSSLKRLTWTSGNSERPSMDIDSLDTIHLVWNDNSSGSKEIYYKYRK